jgi:hypothetical protein
MKIIFISEFIPEKIDSLKGKLENTKIPKAISNQLKIK